MKPKKIVVLRSAEDSEEFADAIRAQGYEPLSEPILSINYPPIDLSHVPKDTPLIFTSAHGIAAFVKDRVELDHPVYVVGPNTAEAASYAGFGAITQGNGHVENLADILAQSLGEGLNTPLYVRGKDVSNDLKGIMAQKGCVIQEIIAYEAVSAQILSLNLLQSLDKREIDAIAFFSARGAAAFAGLIEQYGRAVRLRTVRALCISGSVLQSLSVLPFQSVAVAEKPDRYGMMKLVEDISVN